MSFLLNTVIRRQFGARSMSGSAGQSGAGYKFWQRLTFCVALPTVCVCMINAYQSKETEPSSEFVKYEYLCRREKRFPWGDGTKSLFHNPHVNKLPDKNESSASTLQSMSSYRSATTLVIVFIRADKLSALA
ncbi:levy [Drosophila busckii]|uniref:Levy n=1 Tax=Drosophila busckii TaxID=30019 RepID=A0A0M3QVJ0_DROBS|nr:levy [Drosophila busckii]